MMPMMISEKTKKALSMAAVSAVGTGVSYYVIMALAFDMGGHSTMGGAVSFGIALFVGLSFAHRRLDRR